MQDFPEVSSKLISTIKEDLGVKVGRHPDPMAMAREVVRKFFKMDSNQIRTAHAMGPHTKDEAAMTCSLALLADMRPLTREKLLEWVLTLPVRQLSKQGRAEKSLETMKAEGMLKFMALSRSGMKYGSGRLSGSNVMAELQNDFVTKKEVATFGDKHFYRTREWKELRLAVLSADPKCKLCGCGPEKKPLQVDHIKPRSLWPELSLEPSNMQVLCGDCNWAKSNVVALRY